MVGLRFELPVLELSGKNFNVQSWTLSLLFFSPFDLYRVYGIDISLHKISSAELGTTPSEMLTVSEHPGRLYG